MLEKIYLNGLWDFCPIYGETTSLHLPENITYSDEKIIVPSSWRYRREDGFNVFDDFKPLDQNGYPDEWNDALTGVYERHFNVTEEMLKMRVILCMDGIAQMAAVYINGSFAGKWDEMYLCGKIDITDLLVAGDNKINIVCTSFEQVRIDSGAIKSTGLVGSWYGTVCRGIWNDIYLDFENYTKISDIKIRTYIEAEKIELLFTVTNNTYSRSKLELCAEITDNGKVIRQFNTVISLKTNAAKTIEISDEWKDPILWDTDNPHLYDLTVRLFDNNELIDTAFSRFGFREFKNIGPDFYLNGKRINLRGDSWHFQGAEQMTKQYALNWYKMAKENGVNYIRLHAEPYPEYYLDAADETGMLIVDETAIYGSGKSMYAGDELYLKRCKEHVKRFVARDKNHPSVILWSLQNEMRWVDGRDIFKKQIPEMMHIIKSIDPTRKIILEGDNRLLPYDSTQIDTYHYNIDGTFAQWKREHPLVIGERCGLWYVCPQNASMYVGLGAYGNVYDTFRGFAKKEKLFVEDARRKGVSGVSVFNFAYYFERSMPNEDVELKWDNFEGPGNKPKKITKYSLTINNGYLKDYPINEPNPTLDYIKSAFRPIAIINREYDTSFYDGKEIKRSFDIYNDTRDYHDCKIIYKFISDDKVISEGDKEFDGRPGTSYLWNVSIPAMRVKSKTVITLEAVLYHESVEVFSLKTDYTLYPTIIKILPVDASRKTCFYGNDRTYEIIKRLLPNSSRLTTLDDATVYSPEILILGDHLTDDPNERQMILEDYVSRGGTLICLEQDRFSVGDIHLYATPFISAHMSDPSHPILNGITDDDLMFWQPTVTEEKPQPIITSAFVKPVKGNFKFVLECSCGDYADGGDLWSPLIEYGFKDGKMIFNQLDIIKHFDTVPTACKLLRNILAYAVEFAEASHGRTAAVVSGTGKRFLDACGLEYKEISFTNTYRNNVIITDIQSVSEKDVSNIKMFIQNGGTLFVLPFGQENCKLLSRICEAEIKCDVAPVYHLMPSGSPVTKGISIVDFYRYEKPPMSPRQVDNTVIAQNSVSADKGIPLAQNVTETPWFDYYKRGCADEYAIIPLVSINEEKTEARNSYIWEIPLGMGKIILSQVSADPNNEKDIRVYSGMLSNLGCDILGDVFTYIKSDFDYSVDYFMTLPCPEYKDYAAALAYYTDKRYSLNNLGEGLYGWMRKVEKSYVDGTVTVPDSKNERLFLTCFAKYSGTSREACTAVMTSNGKSDLWINGDKLDIAGKFILLPGENRIVIDAKAPDNDDYSVRLIIKDSAGIPIKNTVYHLTIDEVDPK